MLFGTSFGHRRKSSPHAKVLLTSMMDMFTIILVFLLYNFSAEDNHLTLKENLELPSSSAQLRFQDSINVVVSRDSIFVEDKEVAGIKNGRITGSSVKGKRIHSLYKELRRQKAITQYRSEKDEKASEKDMTVVLLQADKKTPFHILDMVMKSAGMAGYPKFRFAVFRRDL